MPMPGLAGRESQRFDFVVVDFPIRRTSRSASSTARLLPSARQASLRRPDWRSLQSTSPLYARQSFWCVVTTIESVGLVATPYHALVPSFGEWGYVLVGRRAYAPPPAYPVETRFLRRK